MLTAAERKALAAYILERMRELGLREWTIHILSEPPEDEDANASIDPCIGRRVATLRVCPDFRELSRDDQRNAIVHELLHCHHVAATDIIRLDLPRHLAQSTYEILWEGFKRQIEYMVDALADAWAENVPYITWPAPKRARSKA